MNIGKNILELRKKKNETQDELAVRLGVTAAAVSKWENGYTLPDIMMLCALADHFHVTTDELLGRALQSKDALVVASTVSLSDRIEKFVQLQGFAVVKKFSSFRPALNYILSHDNCRYIFTGGPRDIISAQDIRDTPEQINSVHIIGDNDEDILQGFDTLQRNPLLFP